MHQLPWTHALQPHATAAGQLPPTGLFPHLLLDHAMLCPAIPPSANGSFSSDRKATAEGSVISTVSEPLTED